MTQKNYNKIAWGLFGLSVTITTFAWASAVDFRISDLNAFGWFPLFGLIAWTTMATHYFSGAIRIKNPKVEKPRLYKKITGYTVLAGILLHPGILAVELFKNGAGLPPTSFLDFRPALAPSIMMGSVALMVFLSFEIFERLQNKPIISKYWYLISLSQTYAMILIFLHGLSLGNSLGETWFRFVWLIYGIALIPCFYIIHTSELKNRKSNSKKLLETNNPNTA
jgi:hypothetical protein